MKGYGSQCRATATELTLIQTTTTIDWPTMYWGVPKNRATLREATKRVLAEGTMIVRGRTRLSQRRPA